LPAGPSGLLFEEDFVSGIVIEVQEKSCLLERLWETRKDRVFQYPIITHRLYLRPPVEEDTDALMAIFADPEVMKYSPTGCLSKEQIKEKINEWEREYGENNFCPFVVIRQEDSELIGICGLHASSYYVVEGEPRTEIVFRLAKKFWGGGYGFEAAQAVLQDASTKLHGKEIVAIVDVLNERSRKLVEKIGMQWWKQTTLIGIRVDLYRYEITRD
jgi:RimJ/RimL family protein N-acetyltransferase